MLVQNTKTGKAECSHRWFWSVPFAYGLALLLSVIGQPVGMYDEAIPLVNGMLVQKHLIPHVDFWSIYPPMDYYVNAAAFFVFGRSVLTARLVHSILYLVFLFCFYAVLRHEFPDLRRYYATLTFLAIGLIGTSYANPLWVSLSIAILVLLHYLRAMELREPARSVALAAAGLATAFVVLCRINIGAYLVLAVVLDIAIQALEQRTQRGRDMAFNYLSLARGFFVYGIPLLLGVVIFLLFYGRRAFAPVMQTVIEMGRLVNYRFKPLPLDPPRYTLLLCFPIIWFAFRTVPTTTSRRQLAKPAVAIAATAAFFLLLRVFASAPHVLPKLWVVPVATVLIFHFRLKRLGHSELVLLLFYSILLHYPLNRADEQHFAAMLPVVALLLPYGLAPFVGEVSRRAALQIALAVFLVLLPAALFTFLYSLPFPSRVATGAKLVAAHHILDGASDSARLMDGAGVAGGWTGLYGNADELAALRYVYARTSPDSFVYVGVTRHGELFFNNLRAYWLLGRKIGVMRHVGEPGMTTEAGVQAEMASELEYNRVSWVVLLENPAPDEALQPLHLVGSHLLDDYIAANYRVVFRSGVYEVLRRGSVFKAF